MWTIRTPLRLLVATATVLPLALHRAGPGDWPAYGGDAGGSRFSPLTQIHRGNVAALPSPGRFTPARPGAAACRHHAAFEATPIVVDGTMYLSHAARPRHRARPGDRPASAGASTRGSTPRRPSATTPAAACRTWLDPAPRPGAAVPASDRRRDRGCAAHRARRARPARPARIRRRAARWICAAGSATRRVRAGEYEETSPPAVVNGLVVVGSAVADNSRTDAASGEVRALRRAHRRAALDAGIPCRRTRPIRRTARWRGPTAHRTGAANAWSRARRRSGARSRVRPHRQPEPRLLRRRAAGRQPLRQLDRRAARVDGAGRVVVPDRAPRPVGLRQRVAAGAGDRAARRPRRAAVLQATKTGQLFVLDRETGAPIVPGRGAARAALAPSPARKPSPTQPFSAIRPLEPAAADADDSVWAPTPDRAACRAQIAGAAQRGLVHAAEPRGHAGAAVEHRRRALGRRRVRSGAQIAVVPMNSVAARWCSSSRASTHRHARDAQRIAHGRGVRAACAARRT